MLKRDVLGACEGTTVTKSQNFWHFRVALGSIAYGRKTRSRWKHEILSGWFRRRHADVTRWYLCDV